MTGVLINERMCSLTTRENMNSNNDEGYDDDFHEYDPYAPAMYDTEAVAWAYKKLLAYVVGNTTMDNAMMLDRLNAMLQGRMK